MPGLVRRQLSLYVPEAAAVEIEAVRRVVDPVQSRLIPAHVTLCREDELDRVVEHVLLARLMRVPTGPITLRFGPPRAFYGHGILLDCVDGEADFVALRVSLLGTAAISRLKPHVTLAHPRHAKAAGTSLADTTSLATDIAITFSSVRLIEQTDDSAWRVLQAFDL